MNCQAYETDLSGDMVGGIVKIYNEQGQYCLDSFAMDINSIKECRKNPSLCFLLMKTTCGVEKEELYVFLHKNLNVNPFCYDKYIKKQEGLFYGKKRKQGPANYI